MDRNKREHEEYDVMEATHDEVVEAHEQEEVEVVHGVLVDDTLEVAVEVHDVEVEAHDVEVEASDGIASGV